MSDSLIGESTDTCVGVAVVTFNSSLDIAECLISLCKAKADTVVVLDNGSSVEEERRTREICSHFENVNYIASKDNLGFGAGVNLAVNALAEALKEDDFIWIVNPDCVVDERSLRRLQAALLQEHFDIVSPQIITGDPGSEAKVWFNGGSLDLRSFRTIHHGIGSPAAERHTEAPCTFITGAAVFTRLSTWRRLEGFVEDYFLYWEDADLSYRSTTLDLHLGVVSGASVWHGVGGSGDRSGKSQSYYYFMQRNRIFFAKRLGMQSRLLTFPAIAETIRLILRPLKQPQKPAAKFRAGLRGLVVGLISAPQSPTKAGHANAT